MADVSKIKLPNGTTYNIKDDNALPLTGGSVTGPVSFGDSVSIDEATVGDLVVNGSASFTNNLQANTINGVTVGSNPKFTDTNTVTTATTTGSGNAVTAVTASNGALTITKGTTFLTSHQDISGKADKATTLAGYGITDAKIASGVITLGSNTITPLTSSSTLNAAKLSGAIPSTVTATTQASTDNSTKIATTAYVTTAIANLPEPMVFKGSVGTGGTITSLPTAATSNEGHTYKVITALSSPSAKVGDTVISNGSEWIVIPSGDEPSGTVTSVGVSNATNGGLTVSGSPITSSGTVTIGHSNVLSSAQTTQAVYPIKIDKNGHISAYGNAVTIPTVPSNIVNTITTTAGAHTAITSQKGNVSFNVPTKTSHLTNDSGFITSYTDTTYTLSGALSSHTFTSTLTAGGSGSGTSTSALTLVAGNNITLTDDTTNKKITIAATDTTYSSKTAASGGTDVSLVTTGEKYIWNSKTSNTGTVTKVTAGTGLSIGTTAGGNFTTSGTINHTNSVTAQTTQALYPIKIDAQGHISAYGSAITSLPASDVSAWAKASSKPSYTASEVGAVPTTRTVNGKALSANITLTSSDVNAVDKTIPLYDLDTSAASGDDADLYTALSNLGWNSSSDGIITS